MLCPFYRNLNEMIVDAGIEKNLFLTFFQLEFIISAFVLQLRCIWILLVLILGGPDSPEKQHFAAGVVSKHFVFYTSSQLMHERKCLGGKWCKFDVWITICDPVFKIEINEYRGIIHWYEGICMGALLTNSDFEFWWFWFWIDESTAREVIRVRNDSISWLELQVSVVTEIHMHVEV